MTSSAHIEPAPSALAERFELLERLGAGGAGVVYRARSRSGNRAEVAVKIFHSQVKSESDRRQLEREYEALRRLNEQPGVVRVLDFGVDADGWSFLVTERCAGTLADRIHSLGRLEVAEVTSVIERVAGVLAAAHTEGIVHGDIKPSNLFLSDRGLLLGDFGSARISEHTVTATAGLSTEYAAPERFDSSEQDPESDVFSLGATLWHALVGEPPQIPQSIGAISALRRNAGKDAIALGVDSDLIELALQMMERDPRKRPSLDAVRERLGGAGLEVDRRRPPVAVVAVLTAISVTAISLAVSRPSADNQALTPIATSARGAAPEPLPFLGTNVSTSTSTPTDPVATPLPPSVAAAASQSTTTTATTAPPEPPTAAPCDLTGSICDGFEQGLEDWRVFDDNSQESILMRTAGSNSFLRFAPGRLQQLEGGYIESAVMGANVGEPLTSRMQFRVDDINNTSYWWLNIFTLADPSGRQWNLDIQRGDGDRFRFDLRRWSADGSDTSLSEEQFEPGRWYCVELVLNPDASKPLVLLVDGQPTVSLEGPLPEDRALSYAVQVGSSRVEEPQTLPAVDFDDVMISAGAPAGC